MAITFATGEEWSGSARGLTAAQRSTALDMGGRLSADGSIVFPARAENGFDITIDVSGSSVVASFGGLVQDMDDVDSALEWVRRCRVDDVRLKIDYRGSRAHHWTLERRGVDGDFVPMLASGHVRFLPSFRPTVSRYFPNV